MKITIVHGDTQVQISGTKSLKKMKKAVKDIFEFLPQAEMEEAEEPNPIGFSLGASIERATEPTIEYIEEEE